MTRDLTVTPPTVVVGIASAGRRDTLVDTVAHIASLPARPERIIVCVPDMNDAGSLFDGHGVEVMTAGRGLTIQRNRILEAAGPDADIVVFLDDDFIPAPDFFVRMATVFADNPDVVIATGHVLADGILGDSISLSQALDIIDARGPASDNVQDVYNAYGCNMAIRMRPVLQHQLSFDEKLPLYGWLEDVDFSRSIARYGRSVRVASAKGVHMGVKSGRQPGLRLGYSQMANPFYMVGKKTMSPLRAFSQMARNLIANAAGTVRGDRSVDRRGRLSGNLMALSEIVTGRASPARALDLVNQPASSAHSPFVKQAGK
jgi:glycosyltransferase involved in cell wall biosynthesis